MRHVCFLPLVKVRDSFYKVHNLHLTHTMQRQTWLNEQTTLLLILQMENIVRVAIRKPFPKVFSLKKLAISMPGGKGAKN